MDQDKKILDKLWELTQELTSKGRRKAEKLWKINSLRVEIASFRHRINVKYKELGRYVYESTKSGISDEEIYKSSVEGLFGELTELEGEIFERESKIEELEKHYRDLDLADEEDEEELPPVPDVPEKPEPEKPKPAKKPAAKKPAAKKPAAKKSRTTKKKEALKDPEDSEAK